MDRIKPRNPVERVSVAVGLRKRIDTTFFEIVPSLAGAHHTFEFRGKRIEIQLPSRPRFKDWSAHDASIGCNSYSVRGKRQLPAKFIVRNIEAFISSGVSRSVRSDALGTVNHTLYSKRERASLDRQVQKLEALLEAAFNYWLDILRWKSANARLCQYLSNEQESNWGAYLVDELTRARFYRPGILIHVGVGPTITRHHWASAQKALTSGLSVPVWQIFLADAIQKRGIGDIRGFILDLAVALETGVRSLFAKHTQPSATIAFHNLLFQLPVSRILDEWPRLGFGKNVAFGSKAERDSIKRVFELRNKIMHRGHDPKKNSIDSIRLQADVATFLIRVERATSN